MLDWIRFVLTAGFVMGGLFLLATGVIGQFRFKYVLNRMHAASIGDSMGLMMLIIGLCISQNDPMVIVKCLLTGLFIWLTSPTGGHLIARLEVTLNEHPETEMEMIEK